jgi:3',5'-nucleoside bisphosphate phosphatase
MAGEEGAVIDLHAHTTASDGSLTPTELVALARERGLRALGVTDHDTVGGLEEALAAGGDAGVEVVPGIELSVDYKHGEFHLLGYFIDLHSPALVERLAAVQENRRNRNGRMVERLQALGLPLTMEDVVREAGGGQIGRPHMALALVRCGAVGSTQEAFDRYLADGRPGNIPKVRLVPEEAMELLHAAGGRAVLAHPSSLAFPDEASFDAEIARLREAGLDGLEAYYSQHTPEQTARFLALATRLGLRVSGGSDFHGRSKPHVQLGVVHEGRALPAELLDGLRRA